MNKTIQQTIRVRKKNEITLPEIVRNAINVKPDDHIVFKIDEKGRICLEKAPDNPYLNGNNGGKQ